MGPEPGSRSRNVRAAHCASSRAPVLSLTNKLCLKTKAQCFRCRARSSPQGQAAGATTPHWQLAPRSWGTAAATLDDSRPSRADVSHTQSAPTRPAYGRRHLYRIASRTTKRQNLERNHTRPVDGYTPRWTVPCPLPTMHVEEDRRAVKSPRPLLRWRSAPPRRTAQSVPLLVRAITCTGPSDSSIEYLPGPCTTSCSSAPTVESCWLGLGLGLELGQQRAHRRELLRETVPLLSTRTPYCSQLTACC